MDRSFHGHTGRVRPISGEDRVRKVQKGSAHVEKQPGGAEAANVREAAPVHRPLLRVDRRVRWSEGAIVPELVEAVVLLLEVSLLLPHVYRLLQPPLLPEHMCPRLLPAVLRQALLPFLLRQARGEESGESR